MNAGNTRCHGDRRRCRSSSSNSFSRFCRRRSTSSSSDTVGRGAAACQFGGDLVFTIDSSGSIGLINFVQVTSFVSKLAHALDLDDALEGRGDGRGGFRVGLLTFSTGVSVGFSLNTYSDKALLLQALEVRYMDGTTNTADAIRYVTLCPVNTLTSDRMCSKLCPARSSVYLINVSLHIDSLISFV